MESGSVSKVVRKGADAAGVVSGPCDHVMRGGGESVRWRRKKSFCR